MGREIKTNLKKIMALLLVASMLLGMDTAFCAENVYAKESDTNISSMKDSDGEAVSVDEEQTEETEAETAKEDETDVSSRTDAKAETNEAADGDAKTENTESVESEEVEAKVESVITNESDDADEISVDAESDSSDESIEAIIMEDSLDEDSTPADGEEESINGYKGDVWVPYSQCQSHDDEDPVEIFKGLTDEQKKKLEENFAKFLIISIPYSIAANEDPPIYKYPYGEDPIDAIKCMERAEIGDNSKPNKTWYGVIKQSELEKIKELVLHYNGYGTNAYAAWGDMQFSDLAYFGGLETLTIDGNAYDYNGDLCGNRKTISSISFPSSLKSLTIKNCDINTELDLSNCENLSRLEFINCKFTYSAASYEIKGISPSDNDLKKKLKKISSINISGLNISKVELASDAPSTWIYVSAEKCTNLKSFDVGGYKLKGGTSFKECSELEYLNAKGIVSAFNNKNESIVTTEKLNIQRCTSLATLNVDYSFGLADNRLIIDAKGITNTDGEFNFSRTGNVKGKYKLEAIEDTFFYTSITNKSYENNETGEDYFEGLDKKISNSAKYLCFEQDVVNFEKYVEEAIAKNTTIEKSYMTKLRDYKANPILLMVGQKVENNKVYAYTEDMILIENASVPTTITTQYKSDNSENSKVITLEDKDGKGKNTITAVSPGVAIVKASSSGGGSASIVQVIIVYDEVTSLSIDDNNRASAFLKPGKYSFMSTIGVKYSTLVDNNLSALGDSVKWNANSYTIGAVKWNVEKYNAEERKWYPADSTHNYTNEGLRVYQESGTAPGTDGNQLKKESSIEISQNAVGGKYRVWGELLDSGYNGAAWVNSKSQTNDNNKYYEFNIINVSQDSEKIVYQAGKFNSDYYYEKENYSEEVTFSMPYVEEGYELKCDWDCDDVYKQELDKYFEWSEAKEFYSKNGTTQKTTGIKLKFRDLPKGYDTVGKTTEEIAAAKKAFSAEIAKFLQGLRGKYSGNIVPVKCTITPPAGKGETQTYNKSVCLGGYFKLTYDTNGGSLNEKDIRALKKGYEVPLYSNSAISSIPVKTGYSFGGWYDGNVKYTSVVVAGNLDLKAKWDEAPVGDKITESYVYTGLPIEPDITVHCGETVLDGTTDYTISYKNNVNAYTLTTSDNGFDARKAPTVLINGKGNYNNNGGVYFTIQPKSIASDDIQVGDVSTSLFNNKVIKPVPKVTWGKKTLKASQDYSVSYYRYYGDGSNGVRYNSSTGKVELDDRAKAVNPKEAGMYFIRVSGRGNYTGDVYKSFNILSKEQEFDCTLPSGVLYYSGGQVNPQPTVKYNGVTLEAGKDYTVSYKNNVNAYTISSGQTGFDVRKAPSVIIKGKGIFTASSTLYYTIQPKSIVSEEIKVVEIADVKETGRDQKLVPKVTWGKKTLSTKTDYSVAYYKSGDENIDDSGDTVTINEGATEVIPKEAGTYYVRIEGKGNYTGEVIKSFTIIASNRVLVSSLSVSVKNKPYNTGQAVTLGAGELIVKEGRTVLAEKTEKNPDGVYTVSYSNNTEVGTATVTITGADAEGKYYGSKTVTFQITGTPISKAKISGFASNVYYTGREITQEFSLAFGNENLRRIEASEYESITDANNRKAIDYTYEYINNVNPGKATLVITGVNGFTGTVNKVFTIKGNTAINKLTVSGITANVPYTGNAITQSGMKVFNGTYELNGIEVSEYSGKSTTDKKAYDYTYEYQNNVFAGKASIVLKGVNAFTGEVTKTFNITGIPVGKITIGNFKSAFTYTGAPITQDEIALSYKESKKADPVTITAKTQSEYDALSPDAMKNVGCIIEYSNNVNAGTATMTLTGINGCSGVVKKTYKINPYVITPSADTADNFKVTLSSGSYIFDKPGVKPVPTVTFKDANLVLGRDYKLTYQNNTAVNDATGKNKPTVKVTGIGNYKGDDATTIFKIEQRDISVDNYVIVSAPDMVYTGRKGAARASVTVVDKAGNKLAVKKDYSPDIKYTYESECTVIDGSGKTPVEDTREAGAEVQPNDIVPVGSKIKATITGINNYKGTASSTYRIVVTDVNKLSITIAPKNYTGNAIELGEGDLIFKSGKTQLGDVTYTLTDYKNNTNAGKATVVIEGIGNYGGRRTLTFTIGKRGFLWWWNNLSNL